MRQLTERVDIEAEAYLDDMMDTIEELRRHGKWVVVNKVTKGPRQTDLLKGFFTSQDQIPEFAQLRIGSGSTLDEARINAKNPSKYIPSPKHIRKPPREQQQYETVEYVSYEPYPTLDVKTVRAPDWVKQPRGLPGTYFPGAKDPLVYSSSDQESEGVNKLLSNRMLTIDASGSSVRVEMLDVQSNTYYQTRNVSWDPAHGMLKAAFIHPQNGYVIESTFVLIGGTPERIRESFRAGNTSSLNVAGEHILEKR